VSNDNAAAPGILAFRQEKFMIRKHLTFTGRVQGVGFRYRAHSIAVSLGLTGYVMNNYNGTVEAEVQGEPYEIEQFIDELKESSYIRIDYVAEYDMTLRDDMRFVIK
jgi:acylphosphatase